LEDEDIALRLIRMKKLRERMALAAKAKDEAGKGELSSPQEQDPLQELKRHVSERGDEVIDTAFMENPELTRRVADALLKALKSGRLETPIDAGDLLILFRRLGLRVQVESKLMVHRKGETKDLRKALEEGWRQT